MAFDAEMGAGKTTFIRELCQYVGVTDDVSSPTFAIINEYQFKINGLDSKIYHMDWYRLRNEADAINTGVEDTLLNSIAQNAYSFIEWPSIASSLLPKPYLSINIGIIDAATRHLSASIIH
jgi:tRNA threonylcarbamoyladenosine biosynthesis protein TsaE